MKYIDAEKLKAEIDNLESFSCISEEQDGFYSAISRINGIIDSLQQEQPEVFDSAAFQKGVQEGRRLEREDAGRLADASKTISEDLEEAAEKYGSDYPAYNDDQFIAENAFNAGAEWQKAKILKDNPVIMPVEDFQALIDSHAKRVEADYKEKMLKEAVEGFIFQSEDYYPKELVARYNGELKHGDKVKIIIVKED